MKEHQIESIGWRKYQYGKYVIFWSRTARYDHADGKYYPGWRIEGNHRIEGDHHDFLTKEDAIRHCDWLDQQKFIKLDRLLPYEPTDVPITVTWRNEDDEKCVQTATAAEWFSDWFGECELCPANDAILDKVTAMVDGVECVVLERKGEDDDVFFEDLMDAIRPTIVFHHWDSSDEDYIECSEPGSEAEPRYFIGEKSAQRYIEVWDVPYGHTVGAIGICENCGQPLFPPHFDSDCIAYCFHCDNTYSEEELSGEAFCEVGRNEENDLTDSAFDGTVTPDMLAAVFKGNRVIYASVPITTGPRYFDFLRQGGNAEDKDAVQAAVVMPNIEAARKAIKAIRRRTRALVIDPTQVEGRLLNMSQTDFYQFWDSVIQGAPTEVIFLDGWQYSTGCTNELLSAMQAKKKIRTQDLKELGWDEAVKMVGESLAKFKEFGIENKGLQKAYDRLLAERKEK